MRGLVLGLAAGSVCLATCAPVLAPFLLAEGKTSRWNTRAVAAFLGGRLAGYILFAVLAWLVGGLLPSGERFRYWLFAGAYLALAVTLIVYGLGKIRGGCPAVEGRGRRKWSERASGCTAALLLGFFTGLNLCPPFLAAFTEAVDSGSLGGSIFFFLMFYIGTSVYFVPAPLLGLLNRFVSLRTVGQLAAVLVGSLYLFRGVILVYGGLVKS